MAIKVDSDYFSKIPGGTFEIAGDDKTGPLYHWKWYGEDLTSEIERFLKKKRFAKSSFFTSDNATAQGKFTRVEMLVNADPNELVFHVEYFNGEGKFKDQQFIKSKIKKHINYLTWITILSFIVSVIGLFK